MKKTKDLHSEENLLMVQEPAVAYQVTSRNTYSTNIHSNPVLRSLVLMGLEDDTTSKAIASNTDFISYIRNGVPKKLLITYPKLQGFHL